MGSTHTFFVANRFRRPGNERAMTMRRRLTAFRVLAALSATVVCLGDSRGDVTIASSPQELADAIRAGDAHVHVTEHLDMRDFTKRASSTEPSILFDVPEKLQSLTVRQFANMRRPAIHAIRGQRNGSRTQPVHRETTFHKRMQ